MRLWSVNPRWLESRGLAATWRKALLARAVLVAVEAGKTTGYHAHPQLDRFKACPHPLFDLVEGPIASWQRVKAGLMVR